MQNTPRDLFPFAMYVPHCSLILGASLGYKGQVARSNSVTSGSERALKGNTLGLLVNITPRTWEDVSIRCQCSSRKRDVPIYLAHVSRSSTIAASDHWDRSQKSLNGLGEVESLVMQPGWAGSPSDPAPQITASDLVQP